MIALPSVSLPPLSLLLSLALLNGILTAVVKQAFFPGA
jgi:hypothetical protein